MDRTVQLGATRTMKRKHMLIVDDEDGIIKSLSAYFKTVCSELRVQTCINGDEAYRLAIDILWDIVFLDIMLPGHSGWEICEGVRKRGIKTPIVGITALEDDDINRYQAHISGFDGFLFKPFYPEELRGFFVKYVCCRCDKRSTCQTCQ